MKKGRPTNLQITQNPSQEARPRPTNEPQPRKPTTKTTRPHKIKWQDICWADVEKRVFKLQRAIADHALQGNLDEAHRKQKILTRFLPAKFLAIRRVTQDNKGKNTAGVDGAKALSPTQRIELAYDPNFKIGTGSNRIKRVYIQKKSGKLRPLGIPTMRDRALQALAKLALEPQFEPIFEANSYGFRPGRSCHDACEAIHLGINKKEKYVLEADITACFDKINHEALIKKCNTYPMMARQIRRWLKAEIVYKRETTKNESGTPQGGVISPLLANIALHGLEEYLKGKMTTIRIRDPRTGKVLSAREKIKGLLIVRYADDFIVAHEDLEILLWIRNLIEEWLKQIGLELNPDKTKISHTRKTHGDNPPGFDFLGFHVQQYNVGKYRTGKRKQGFKTIIKPTKLSLKEHHRALKDILRSSRTLPAIVQRLNSVTTGWANYYSHAASKRTFAKADLHLMAALRRWTRIKHPTRRADWLRNRYLKRINNRLRFGYEPPRTDTGDATNKPTDAADQPTTANQPKNRVAKSQTQAEKRTSIRRRPATTTTGRWRYVRMHAETPIVRHTKVRGKATPYDGNWTYWGARGRNIERRSPTTIKILNRQRGACRWCGQKFWPWDTLEIDHITPKRRGGQDRWTNLQLIHKHCHDNKTREE